MFFWLAFGSGLLAVVMPCVFPMIPMTVSFFMHGDANKAKAKAKAIFFSLSCLLYTSFPKDVKALIRTGDDHGHSLELLKAVERVNENQKSVLFRKVTSHFGKDLKGKHFAMWGLAFKPGTDDMREAPSLVLIDKLLEAGATVRAFDPVAVEECRRRIGDRIEYAENMYDALEGADALIVVTEWAEFKIPKFTFIAKALKHKIIFDGRNIYLSLIHIL